MKDPNRKRILFLCTHNSARSQMAEGLLRARYGDRFDVFSAGTVATFVKPMAVEVLSEIGIDISGQHSKELGQFLDQPVEVVVTVCDSAKETCPIFPNAAKKIHHAFPDPSDVVEPLDARRQAFRDVRDQMSEWIEVTFR